MISDYFALALKSLGKRKTRTYLTMIGIFIGIAAVVSLIGLGEGLRIAITSQFGSLGTDVLTIQASGLNFGPPGSGAVEPLTDDLSDKISRINGVESAQNRYIETGTIIFNDRQTIGYAYSIPEGSERKTFETTANIKIYKGRLLKDGDIRKVIVGYDFTKDSMFGKPVAIGDRIVYDDIAFEVIGILEKKGSFIYDTTIAMNEDTLTSLFRKDDSVSMIAVKVKDEKEIDNVKEDIERFLRKERGVKKGEENFEVQSSQQALEQLNSTLFAVQLFVYIIAGISIVVGGIGITNTMYTAVLERTKEIGIMKSIGARNSMVFTLFFIESGLLGLIGGLIGILLGLSFAYGLSAIGRIVLGSDMIQASVSIWLITGALMFSFAVGLAAGVIPAYQASRKNPVDSLRYAK